MVDLLADKIEQPVLDDRPADRAAELVLLQAVADQRGGAAAVEQIVADVFEDVAVHCVGAGARGDA